jgi:hypothetical protein
MADRLQEEELGEFLSSASQSLVKWLPARIVGMSRQITYEDQFQEVIDLQTDTTFWKISSTAFTAQDVLELAMVAWFADVECTSIGILLPLEGRIYTLDLPQGWAQKAAIILARARSKTA